MEHGPGGALPAQVWASTLAAAAMALQRPSLELFAKGLDYLLQVAYLALQARYLLFQTGNAAAFAITG